MIAIVTVLFSVIVNGQTTPYCAAIRGNGELAPAHWGAMGKVIEDLGLPKAMAGGSSATVTMFFVESIAQNPLVKSAPPVEQGARASFLIKSLHPFVEVIAARPEWRDMMALAAYLQQQGGGEGEEFFVWIRKMVETDPEGLANLILQNIDKIKASLQAAINLGLVDPQTFAPIFKAFEDYSNADTPEKQAFALRQIRFFAGEVYQSVVLLGKFDAQSDQNLFFRKGLVNFPQLALSLGRVANFYAARGFHQNTLHRLQNLFDQCLEGSRNRTWGELRAIRPACDRDFKELVATYVPMMRTRFFRGSRESDPIGTTIPSFATTTILKDAAVDQVRAAQKRYFEALDPEFGKSFSVDTEFVRFGYWGRSNDLDLLEKALKEPKYSADQKSQLFFPLGSASWSQILALSPAEPGLSPLVEFKAGYQPLISAGGWSDLHPVTVLKAYGCENVVYVTRRGGESLFGQGVAKRLFGFTTPPWDHLATQPEEILRENQIRNNNGDPSDLSSLWSRLYNLANPQSSFVFAMRNADATLCSNWNDYDIKAPGGVEAMIHDSYHSPFALKDLNGEMGKEAIAHQWRLVLPHDNAFDPSLGFKPFAGCLP